MLHSAKVIRKSLQQWPWKTIVRVVSPLAKVLRSGTSNLCLNPERCRRQRWIKFGNLAAPFAGFRRGETCELAGGHPNGLHAEGRHGHMSARHGDGNEQVVNVVGQVLLVGSRFLDRDSVVRVVRKDRSGSVWVSACDRWTAAAVATAPTVVRNSRRCMEPISRCEFLVPFTPIVAHALSGYHNVCGERERSVHGRFDRFGHSFAEELVTVCVKVDIVCVL